MAHLMVVDDDTVARVLARHIITSLGHSVVEMADGDEALDYIGGNGLPDMILCDQEMPGLTGVEFRKSLGETTVPFVLLTGYGDSRDFLQEEDEALFDIVATKPISSKELGTYITQLLATKVG